MAVAGFVIAGFAGAMESTFHDWLSGDASIFPSLLMSSTRYKKILEKDGYDVQAYNDPRLALKSFKRDLFNLVLLDIRMPHMDGFKLFEQIRKKNDKEYVS